MHNDGIERGVSLSGLYPPLSQSTDRAVHIWIASRVGQRKNLGKSGSCRQLHSFKQFGVYSSAKRMLSRCSYPSNTVSVHEQEANVCGVLGQ